MLKFSERMNPKKAIHNEDLIIQINKVVLQFLCRSLDCVPLSKNTAWLILTALSAPKEYWLDIATIGLCFYFF